ncbi:hypothetical protein AMECASPLE_029634 [Ameca splendens]|uniref:Uncharacterized protein n=1 Tax=Ameca splendens TaxID=208324 RepID=A0ABV0YH36_9TELE
MFSSLCFGIVSVISLFDFFPGFDYFIRFCSTYVSLPLSTSLLSFYLCCFTFPLISPSSFSTSVFNPLTSHCLLLEFSMILPHTPSPHFSANALCPVPFKFSLLLSLNHYIYHAAPEFLSALLS